MLTAALPICGLEARKLTDPAVLHRAKRVLADMIEAYGDHPCIWSWSLGEGIPDDTPEDRKSVV